MPTIDEVEAKVGEEVGVSDWITVDQARINAFAENTGDRQFIHLDAERAKAETPFGGTIAHGFLTLSLLSQMGGQALPAVEGVTFGVNYGFDYLRFLQPVPAGGKIRGRFTLKSLDRSKPGQARLVYSVSVEIEGSDKPALVADWVTMMVLGE